MTATPLFWAVVALIFAVNGVLSWVFDAPVLAVAQAVTAALATAAAWATHRLRQTAAPTPHGG